MTDKLVDSDTQIGPRPGLERFLKEYPTEGIEITITPPTKYETPSTYDLNKVPEESRELISQILLNYQQYLNCPIIKDNFNNHTARRAWRFEMDKQIAEIGGLGEAMKFDEELGKNKMKRNKMSPLYSYADMLSYDETLPQELRNLANKILESIRPTLPAKITNWKEAMLNPAPDPWDGPTTDDKIKTVDKISQSVANFLNYFAPQETK